ncbi:SDR family NAD(P)-dependent oxidoreductase [Halalkalirubrum salinum]|uniref:SDR family NAD(P)-dependent oxidoreductase n=1 Tax=Halalkalirubrum salinum TaxID=2563889 RepID=UPI0010FB8E54|nr:SDR family oxidoreductase [Halalkalirubrum salinum]
MERAERTDRTTSDRSKRSLALVTGAASGIGKALASIVARNGHDLLLIDVDEEPLAEHADRLADVHGVWTEPLALDLTADGAVDRIDDRLAAIDGRVDVLCNNAGVPVYGRFTETDFDDERAMIELNVVATTALTKRIAPRMVDRGHGHILHTASLAGVVPVPTAAIYGATKAYVRSFSLALATELRGTGVTVTTLCPGETNTAFLTRGGMDRSAIPGRRLQSPRSVAEVAYQGMIAGDRVVVPSQWDRLRYILGKLLPEAISARITERFWSG